METENKCEPVFGVVGNHGSKIGGLVGIEGGAGASVIIFRSEFSSSQCSIDRICEKYHARRVLWTKRKEIHAKALKRCSITSAARDLKRIYILYKGQKI